MRISLYDYCLQNDLEEPISQWHPELNGTLTPDGVTPGSHKKVWWICEKGHEWQAEVKSRVAGCGCPVCTRRTIVPYENDLAATHPHLISQWHPTLNGSLTPNDVTAGAEKKAWWICEKGHVWQAEVGARARNNDGCPVCAGKVILPGFNDLASHFPEVAAQWHPTRNGELAPDHISPYSNRKVWWVCELGHEYQSTVASRTRVGTGCPYCAGRKVLPGFNDLATRHPDVAAQWHPTLNGALTPQMVTSGSHKRVWWICGEDHVWQSVVHSRTSKKKCGCPVCAGKVKSKNTQSVYHEE